MMKKNFLVVILLIVYVFVVPTPDVIAAKCLDKVIWEGIKSRVIWKDCDTVFGDNKHEFCVVTWDKVGFRDEHTCESPLAGWAGQQHCGGISISTTFHGEGAAPPPPGDPREEAQKDRTEVYYGACIDESGELQGAEDSEEYFFEPNWDYVDEILVNESEQLDQIVKFNDTNLDEVQYELDGPEFIKIQNNGSGNVQITLNPSFEDSGQFVTTITAIKGGNKYILEIPIIIKNVNRSPVLEPINPITIDENDMLTISIAASDPDGQPVEFAFNDLHSFQEFSSIQDNGDNTATITLSPDFDHSGMYNPSIIVRDNDPLVGQSEQTIEVVVQNVNRPPILEPINPITIDENDMLTISIAASDPDGQPVEFAFNDLHSFQEFSSIQDNGDNTATITLSPDFDHSGIYNPNIIVRDNDPLVGQSEQTIEVVVQNVNRPPEIESIDMLIINEGNKFVQVIKVSDPDLQAVELEISGLPPFTTLKSKGEGIFEIDIKPGFKTSGFYTMFILASDSDPDQLMDSEELRIHVVNVLQPLPSTETVRYFSNDSSVIELQIQNWTPNLATQVQVYTNEGWKGITNENFDDAWLFSSIEPDGVMRFAYGQNALGGLYRWVIYDKSEYSNQGWAVSQPFSIDQTNSHIIISTTLPSS